MLALAGHAAQPTTDAASASALPVDESTPPPPLQLPSGSGITTVTPAAASATPAASTPPLPFQLPPYSGAATGTPRPRVPLQRRRHCSCRVARASHRPSLLSSLPWPMTEALMLLPPDSGAAAVVACAPGHVRDTKRENTLESDDTVDHADKVTPRLQSLYRLQCYSRLTTPQLKYTHKAHPAPPIPLQCRYPLDSCMLMIEYFHRDYELSIYARPDATRSLSMASNTTR